MTDSLVQGLASLLGGKVSGEVIIFIISMIPILELRGGLLAASFVRAHRGVCAQNAGAGAGKRAFQRHHIAARILYVYAWGG